MQAVPARRTCEPGSRGRRGVFACGQVPGKVPVIEPPRRRAGDGHGVGGLMAGRKVRRQDERAANWRRRSGDAAGPDAKAIYKAAARQRPGEFDRARSTTSSFEAPRVHPLVMLNRPPRSAQSYPWR